jgi:hypothetical protein
MKRIFVVVAIVLMLGVAAFAPYPPASNSEVSLADLAKRTPTSAPGTVTSPTPSTKSTPTAASVTLGAPTLLSPANGSTVHTGNVTFAWTAVPGAARYHLQAGSGTAFDQQYNIIERWTLTEPSYTFNVTSGFVVYFPRLYWRVQAIDANNVQGPWSQVWYFNLVSP